MTWSWVSGFFFTQAVGGTLKTFPLLNVEIRGEEILIKKYYDIGIAAATDQDPVVPVVRDVDRLSFSEIERRIALPTERARSGSLTLKDRPVGSAGVIGDAEWTGEKTE